MFGIFVGLGALLLWYFSALAIDKSLMPKNGHYLIQLCIVVAGALSGSVVGATVAFKYNKSNEDKKERDELIGNLVRANMVMAGHIEHVLTMLNHIEESKGKAEIDYLFNLRNFCIKYVVQKQSQEGFQLILKDAPWLLSAYHDMESAVFELNYIVEERNNIFEHQIKPKLYNQDMVSNSKVDGLYSETFLIGLFSKQLYQDYISSSHRLVVATLINAHKAVYNHKKITLLLSENFHSESIPVYGDIEKIESSLDKINNKGEINRLVAEVNELITMWE